MACLVLLTTATVAIPCWGQSTPPDSAAASDTARDTTPAGVPKDSAVASPGDTAPAAQRDSAAPSAPPAAPPAPVDSALGAACTGAAGAPDLLLVTFRSTATEADRDSVARVVGGAVVGPSEHGAPGSWYLRVPDRAHDPSVADQLIQLPPVIGVGTTSCPS